LQQYGFDAVIAPSFSDIFAGNSTQMGLLLASVPEEHCRRLMEIAEADPSTEVRLDLLEQRVQVNDMSLSFIIDEQAREILLNGLDDVSLMLARAAELAAYEARRPRWLPTAHSKA
jgi:3-isopropylmalate/(R)-2-methylmalate dehydratase small subunit